MPSRLGTDWDSVRSLVPAYGLRTRKLKPNLDRFQETIPARLRGIKRAQPCCCSDCGGEDAECQEASLSESQPMITWPDAHEPRDLSDPNPLQDEMNPAT